MFNIFCWYPENFQKCRKQQGLVVAFSFPEPRCMLNLLAFVTDLCPCFQMIWPHLYLCQGLGHCWLRWIPRVTGSWCSSFLARTWCSGRFGLILGAEDGFGIRMVTALQFEDWALLRGAFCQDGVSGISWYGCVEASTMLLCCCSCHLQ